MPEAIDPVTGPYLAAAHNDSDFAEWMRYAVELKLFEAAQSQEAEGIHPPIRNNREVVTPSV